MQGQQIRLCHSLITFLQHYVMQAYQMGYVTIHSSENQKQHYVKLTPDVAEILPTLPPPPDISYQLTQQSAPTSIDDAFRDPGAVFPSPAASSLLDPSVWGSDPSLSEVRGVFVSLLKFHICILLQCICRWWCDFSMISRIIAYCNYFTLIMTWWDL